jgi:uncharacterized membrane protein
MGLIEFAVLISALLCSLVAGLVFTFAILVMPGTAKLGDRAFLQAFKAIDRVIQNNQPAFILVWLGSAVALLASAVLGIWQLQGLDRILLIAACLIYLLGVQAPTIAINVPLNNQLQSQELGTMNETALAESRARFEPRWLRWNTVRTVLAIVTTVLLLVLLVRL